MAHLLSETGDVCGYGHGRTLAVASRTAHFRGSGLFRGTPTVASIPPGQRQMRARFAKERHPGSRVGS